MKKIILSCYVCFAFISSLAQSVKTISVPDIKEIKIFQSGAQVSRVIKTSVASGVTILSVVGLSAGIDKNSISVNGHGDFMILSVVHQLDYLNSGKKLAEQEKLEDSLVALQNIKTKKEGLESVYEDEQELLKSNKSVGGANSGVTVDNLQKVDNYFRTQMLDLNAKLIDIHADLKKIADIELKIKQQLTEMSAEKSVATSKIDISISAKSQTNVSLELTYYLESAGWTPFYDVRAKDVNSPVQLSYKANVFQKTGEMWDDVKLTLSTGNPAQGGTKPTLTTWFLDFYQPRTRTYEEIQSAPLKDVNVRGSRSDATGYYVDGVKVNPGSSMADVISVQQNQLSTDFDIPINYSIPSDGKMQTVDIQKYELPAAYNYFAVPKLDKDAFLVARMTGWEELNLLPGLANIYFEGSYIGESVIDPRITLDTLDISLGRDKKVIITREKKKDLNDEKFIGGNVEKELTYLITVRNTKKEKISITIEDQFPVTKNSDIAVKTIESSEANYNSDSGKLTWRLELQPSTNVEKKISYSVKYPKDKDIRGL